MQNKSKTTLICFIISLILIFVFIYPLFSSVKSMYFDLSNKNKQIERLNELLEETNRLKYSYEVIAEEAEKVLLTLPEERDFPDLLVQFEKIAQNNGLLLKSIDFGDVVKKEQKDLISDVSDYGNLSQSEKLLSVFRSMPVVIKTIGSYQSFRNYIIALEKNVRSMDIYLIKFGTNTDKSLLQGAGIFEFDLSINVYYR